MFILDILNATIANEPIRKNHCEWTILIASIPKASIPNATIRKVYFINKTIQEISVLNEWKHNNYLFRLSS